VEGGVEGLLGGVMVALSLFDEEGVDFDEFHGRLALVGFCWWLLLN
jgi:hypothetical protein